MIRATALTLGLVFSFVFHALADITLVQKLEAPDGTMVTGDITIRASNSKTRVDMGTEMSTISDDIAKKVITLIHGQKMAMEMPANVVNQMQEKMKDQNSEADNLVFTPTGKSETINGFDCDEYTFIVDSQTVSAWFAKDLKEKEKISIAFKQLAESSNPMAASMAKFDDMPGVPIRTEVDLPGSGKTAVTLQSISTDPIPADVFDIPAGYQSMAMPQIPGVN